MGRRRAGDPDRHGAGAGLGDAVKKILMPFGVFFLVLFLWTVITVFLAFIFEWCWNNGLVGAVTWAQPIGWTEAFLIMIAAKMVTQQTNSGDCE